ncbi:PiggyBac transposable element-derived protein 2 [Eumeta japonica]|uniref:PiggyBac transposable element-derived protein 2 n=1 Tax=Eumeta variegata TaxID=151549 RepID=A0A4C1ZS70_EUMVA|nr:PiggyBac transposable element-derived protein 2 [Eumeta japonica]
MVEAKRRQPSVIPFTEFEGMKPPYSNLLKEAGPDQYYDLLVPEEILEMIAEQTNLFASQTSQPGKQSLDQATVMSRNRFELLLQYLHFSDNLSVDRNDRIAKIRPLIDALNATFQKYYSPKEDVCVDESQVPFRGRIIFRQYNKSKRHKYVCPTAQYSSTAPCRSRSTNKVTVSMAGGEKSSLNMTIR